MRPATRGSRVSGRQAEILDGLVDLFLAEGFLSFSIDDLAVRLQCSKSTLYTLASSKEQLITTVVRAFFKRATDLVEERLAAESDPIGRIGAYLEAISTALSPASGRFIADLDSFAPAREIYLRNTSIAARRVQQLVRDADGGGRAIDAAFIGAVAATVMESIQRGELETMTGLTDADAYQLLSELIVAGVAGSRSDR